MEFSQSDIFLTITSALIGAIISAIFFILGKNKKLLEYQIASVNLITEEMTNIPGISIMLDGEPIKNLIATTIKFINSGNQTICPDDFAKLEPLSTVVTDQFLSTENGYQINCDNPNSCPSIKIIGDNTANIEFDFLKPKQSFTITLWHSGNLSVLGELKTGKKRKYTGFHKSLFAFFVLSIIMCIATLIATCFLDYMAHEISLVFWSLYGMVAGAFISCCLSVITKFLKGV